MLPSRSVVLLLFVSCSPVIAGQNVWNARGADCSKSYSICAPQGAATTDEPDIGSGLASLYTDIMDTISSGKKHSRDVIESDNIFSRASGGSLCCADGTECLSLHNYNLPFCYDNYTTNYFLPGGAYGQIVSGSYTAPGGSMANLINGNYTLSHGTSGNIYGSPLSLAKLDTATLPIPTQYTASGSGTAIPATALGQEITYTTTIPGTTKSPLTVSAVTVAPIVVSGSTVNAGITEPASTVPGTTVAAETSTVTTKLGGVATAKTSEAIPGKPRKLLSAAAAAAAGLLLVSVFPDL